VKVTIKDVAVKAGVDPSTVSRIINNDSKLSVREETRNRILETIRELGYRPNALARGLRLNSSSTIGMLIPDITNPLFPAVIKGVESYASEKDLSLILCNTGDAYDKERKLIQLLLNRRVDGLLLASAHLREDTIAEVEKTGVPFVLVNRGNRKDTGACVVADNAAGSKMAVRHLLDLGHRKIAHIAGFLYTDSGIERLEGYRKELNRANISVDSEYMVEAGYSEESGYIAMQKLLKLPHPPTAVFAVNDLTAMGAIMALQEAGIRVPEEMSIVGFDDTWIAKRIEPALTTVKVPLYQMGHLAMQMLYQMMNGLPVEEPRIILETSLVIRRSTGPVGA
jgi:DNA-binding LacI/PurR family transcriptional regulator